MSATFRLDTKKKVSQDELRRLMAQQKKPKPTTTKINNPLAKYNESGQLTCVLCGTVVRSENVWPVHVNAKLHKDNVAEAKRLKELTNNFTSAAKIKKRAGTPPPNAPAEKKIKGILKNAPKAKVISQTIVPPKTIPNVSFENDTFKNSIRSKHQKLTDQPSTSAETAEENNDETQTLNEPIPEGFFDDPILDAKARNMEYKDPVEEEWEKFQKEIREETSASADIIAGEQEEATAERQIDEIDEQIRNWSRVLDLELKKDETKSKAQEIEQMENDDNADESDNDADIDEFLDWRAKKSYR